VTIGVHSCDRPSMMLSTCYLCGTRLLSIHVTSPIMIWFETKDLVSFRR